ncbi:hypothetical protein NX021_15395 [Cytobacillus firmus]|nr:hypothetical protein [Cytobacillus firmus]
MQKQGVRNKTKQLIHEMFMQGNSYKEIAEAIGSNAAAVAARVRLYRQKEPHLWPRLKKYDDPLNIEAEVYKCLDCEVLFAIEKELEFLKDVTCPFCWETRLQMISSTVFKVKNLETH